MLIPSLLLALSFFVLYLGAELALASSEKIGRKLGLSPFVIGMVLVGFGTSLPEFFVSHLASSRGEYSMALGNIIGSNLGNLFLILGLSALLMKLPMRDREVTKQTILHLILTLITFGIVQNKEIGTISMGVLFSYMFISLYFIFTGKSGEESEEKCEGEINLFIIAKLILGFYLLYFGGELLVDNGKTLCSHLNISPYIVSVILVAFGTSLPELITSLVAISKKKDTGLIVGNILGSNLLNIAFVLGSLGVYKFQITENLSMELYFLLGGGGVLALCSLLKKNLGKLIGLLFLVSYGYIISYWLR